MSDQPSEWAMEEARTQLVSIWREWRDAPVLGSPGFEWHVEPLAKFLLRIRAEGEARGRRDLAKGAAEIARRCEDWHTPSADLGAQFANGRMGAFRDAAEWLRALLAAEPAPAAEHPDVADIRKRLEGHPDSLLTGENGLAAATMRAMRAAESNVERLRGWLEHIAGGDTPCTEESQLRQWAYEAHTLNTPAPARGEEDPQ